MRKIGWIEEARRCPDAGDSVCGRSLNVNLRFHNSRNI